MKYVGKEEMGREGGYNTSGGNHVRRGARQGGKDTTKTLLKAFEDVL